MWKKYYNLTNEIELLEILSRDGEKSRIIAGGTDLMLELERRLRPNVENLLDISRIQGFGSIKMDKQGRIHISPMVTHNDVLKSYVILNEALPLYQACMQVGSPQIRNRGTIIGNLVTASPANDTISPLIALDASLVLSSVSGERVIKLSEFYRGVRKTTLSSNEFVKELFFNGLKGNQKGVFIKSALRKAQAISVVNTSIILNFDEKTITKASITLGSVAPTIIHATSTEDYLEGKALSREVIETATKLAANNASPISDVRGSNEYRSYIVYVIVKNGLEAIAQDQCDKGLPRTAVCLDTSEDAEMTIPWDGEKIITTINGITYTFTSGFDKSLLHLLREEAGLTGTKEGCGEGECGACTVHMDGKAVMSCLVPAPRAHGANITTIEGIQKGEQLHPIQQAFIDFGAVQCGFCTPGFIMSAVKLLEEIPHPNQDEIKLAITGNLCRCTGYYKIVQAIEAASQ